MIDEDESNPISILFTVLIAIIIMAFTLIVAGTIIDKSLNSFDAIISPNLDTWGDGMYANIVTDMGSYVYLIPGAVVMIFLVWGVKASIKKQTYGRQDDEFMSGDNL